MKKLILVLFLLLSISFGISAVPGKATLISPKNWKINDHTPTYKWNVVNGASWYYLWIEDQKGRVFKKWYKAVDVCGATTCSIKPQFTLSDGEAKWWIQTWNSNGYGPWSDVEFFGVGFYPPFKVELISPNKHIASTNIPIIYEWKKDIEATWYQLWVEDKNGVKINEWYEASSICSNNDCAITLTSNFVDGYVKWWVRGWNPTDYGPWSDVMTFSVGDAKPLKTKLRSPLYCSTDNTPKYEWEALDNATWYQLWVEDESGVKINKWYEASNICNNNQCSIEPTTALKNGLAKWWVRAWNNKGYGSWNGVKIEVAYNGFNWQFNDNTLLNWVVNTSSYADWDIVSKKYLYTEGLKGKWAITYYVYQTYSNFEYEVKMWRDGEDSSANGIYFRGDATTVDGLNNWKDGYSFVYRRDGEFSIWKNDSIIGTVLVDWTYSSAINKGSAWNTLKVRANGSNMTFYINGVEVATVTDNTYQTGNVGIAMYKTSASNGGDKLWVDYAKLSTFP